MFCHSGTARFVGKRFFSHSRLFFLSFAFCLSISIFDPAPFDVFRAAREKVPPSVRVRGSLRMHD